LFVVRAVDLPSGLERYYQRYYINMDRRLFDRWLLSLVPAAVDFRAGRRLLSYQRQPPGFLLTFLENGRSRTETARVLVGADGAGSRVRRQAAGPPPAAEVYFALQERVEAERSQPYFSALFDPAITDYYCWTVPKGEQLLIGAALRPWANTAARFDQFKERLRQLGVRLGKTLDRQGAYLLRPKSGGAVSLAGPGIALVGEAGGWISPSSAEGLSYAFRTALALAEALRAKTDGFERRYQHRTRPLRRNIALKNLKARLIFNPALRCLAMRSGLKSMEVYLPQG
jgi:flavin-dependent dehydrogenase